MKKKTPTYKLYGPICILISISLSGNTIFTVICDTIAVHWYDKLHELNLSVPHYIYSYKIVNDRFGLNYMLIIFN